MIHFWGFYRYKKSDNLIGWEFKKDRIQSHSDLLEPVVPGSKELDDSKVDQMSTKT